MKTNILETLSSRDELNILIVRTDRIGDVVLSTPVPTSIRTAKPNWKISMLVKPFVAELLDGHPDIDEVIRLETDEKPRFFNTRNLVSRLKSKRFDVVIHLFSDFWVSLACRQAGIAIRIGPASKLGRIFYNHKITQHRSRGGRHETDYNLDILKPLGIPPVRKSSLPYSKTLPSYMAVLLLDGKKHVGIFPGMGGSARNWKPKKYAELADKLKNEGVEVILLAGPGEEYLIREVMGESSLSHESLIGSSLKDMAGFIKRLSCFVAPSTGPLHIATAVGTRAVGIYCPIRVCLPERWGPIGKDDKSFTPDVPSCEKCRPESCKEYDCMDKLPVEPVAKAVMEKL